MIKIFLTIFANILLLQNILVLCSCDNNEINYSFNENNIEINEYCLVDLRGEVRYPGIYKVKVGSLINDVIKLAGGLTEYANLDNINLVNDVSKNMKLVIPSINNKINNDSNNLINLNTSTLAELMTIPKIGEAKAKAIISYREENGGFKSIEELKNVSGIGESLYEAIKTYITV